MVVEAAGTLAAHEVAPHLVEAAEAALRAIDWPSATADYIARIAASRGQQAIWRRPPEKSDPAPLSAAERASVVAADGALSARLRALQQRFPPQGEVATHRPRAYRSRLAVALRRDAPQAAAHLLIPRWR